MDHFQPEELVFEVPVYRLSYDDFYERLFDRMRQAADSYVAHRPASNSRREEEAREWASSHVRRRYGRPYWYNEMIGVIRLYQDGASIKGQFWGQPQRAFRWNFQHYRYEHRGRVLEYHAGPVPRSSQEIYKDLHELLSDMNLPRGPLANRHVDLFAFERVGPHVDWTEVLGWEAP